MGSDACSSNFQSRPHPKLVCIFALVRSWSKIRRRAAGGDKFLVRVLSWDRTGQPVSTGSENASRAFPLFFESLQLL